MKKSLLFLPLLLLLALVAFLLIQLQKPNAISPTEDWQGKPLPEFAAKNLLDEQAHISQESLPQEPFILNVWASWCTWCIKEFPMLLNLKAQGVKIVGLTYSDKPSDARNALSQWGNPFWLVIDEYHNPLLLETLKVSSAPSSYLIDAKGVIRYQQKGYDENFEAEFLPRWQALKKESE